MNYLDRILLLAVLAFFVREVIVSMRRGYVSSRGWTARRDKQPVQFWFGISAWTLIAVSAIIFLVLLTVLKANPQ